MTILSWLFRKAKEKILPDEITIGSRWKMDDEDEFCAEVIDMKNDFIQYSNIYMNPFCSIGTISSSMAISVMHQNKFRRVYSVRMKS
jgi:hypothetical protein